MGDVVLWRIEFPAVQCLWPARDGTYPWEEGAAFFVSQPLLYETELLSARMMHYVEEQQLEATSWPFANDPHQRVFVSRCIVEDNAPIIRVVHERDGDWQFIGPVADPNEDGCKLSCFHCVVERDKSVRRLARLSPGWQATRNTPMTNGRSVNTQNWTEQNSQSLKKGFTGLIRNEVSRLAAVPL